MRIIKSHRHRLQLQLQLNGPITIAHPTYRVHIHMRTFMLYPNLKLKLKLRAGVALLQMCDKTTGWATKGIGKYEKQSIK